MPAPQEPGQPRQAPAPKPRDEVKIWSLETGQVLGTITGKAIDPNQNNPRDMVVALAFSRDGKTLATASRTGVVKLWDAASLAPRPDLAKRVTPPVEEAVAIEASLAPRPDLAKQGGGVDVIQFSNDGKTLAAANALGLVTLWDVETGKIKSTFTHVGGMNHVLFSPDGKLFATGGGKLASPNEPEPASESPEGSGGDVRLWDVATGERVAVLPMPSGKVMRLAFSPDGRTLAASTGAPIVTLWNVANPWDAATIEPIVSLAWPSGPALYLAFSPDGKALATGGEDETLRVWDVPAGTLRADLAGHSDAIDWVAFAPDGKTIATASRDATVKLWAVPPARTQAHRP